MSEPKNLYESLGVARDADLETMRKAYRKLARQTHPDLNPGDQVAEERFKEISRAWEVLSDSARRSNYDEFGEVSLEAGFEADRAREVREAFGARFGTRGHTRPGAPEDDFHFGDIDDLLGRMFSREAEAAPGLRLRGADLETGIELDFLEAIRGGEKQLTLNRPGMDGRVATENLTIRIPPGVDSNGRLRIPGKGGSGIGGGGTGDLWVTIRVSPHRVFRREGKNLTCDVPISVREAILGGQVEVPTLDGRATLTVPAGTNGGTRMRLRGKGVPSASGGTPGDLLVRLQVKVPEALDEETKKVIDSLRRFEDPEIRKELFR